MLDLYVNVTLNFCCFLFNYETNVHYTDDSKLLGLLFIGFAVVLTDILFVT